MKTAALPHEVEALLEQLLDRSPAEQQAILARERPGNPAVCAEVETLLARAAPAFLDRLPALSIEELFPLDPGTLEQGTGLSDYEVQEEIGRGGMAVVYRARQISLDRIVALKRILIGQLALPGEVARFRAEALAVARLQHPNIVQIHAIGEHDGVPFLSLEYVEGGTLAGHLAGQPLPPEPAARLAETLAWAMQHAHERGIVHLDLKPGNILLAGDLVPKIADFGLARNRGEGGPLPTETGVIRGTPAYMAPEQAEGRTEAIGRCSDVYALGAILYELLTGRPPFQAATALETLEQVRSREPVLLRQLQPNVPRDLETIVLKCLHKDPARRYASAAALAEDLHRFLAGQPIQARPVGAVEHAWRWCRRNPTVASLAAALLLALLGGSITGFSLWRRAVSGEQQALDHLEAARAALARAEENEQATRRLLDEFAQLASITPGQPPAALRQQSLELLTRTEAHYRQLLREHGGEIGLKIALAGVYSSRGGLHFHHRQWEEAEQFLEKSLGLWEQLAKEKPDNPVVLDGLALAHHHLAHVYENQGRLKQALPSLRVADSLWRNQGEETAAIGLRLVDNGLAVSRVLIASGQHGEGLQCLEETHGRLDHLAGGAVVDAALQARIARANRQLASVYRRMGYRPRALEVNQRAVQIYQDLLHAQRGDAALGDRATWLLDVVVDRVYLHREQGQGEESTAAARRTAELVARYGDRLSGDPASLESLACRLMHAALILRAAGALPETALVLECSARLFEELIRADPEQASYHVHRSETLAYLGKVCWTLGQPEKALAALRQAVDERHCLWEQAPLVQENRLMLSKRYDTLVHFLLLRGRLAEAEDCFLAQEQLWGSNHEMLRELSSDLHKLAEAVGQGRARLTLGEQVQRQRYLEQSRRLGRLADETPASRTVGRW
jgi:tetratricopeptide (TPR) repeat protein